VANLASLELHTSLSRAKPIKRPTMMVFDLDPGPPAAILDCCRVGLLLRDALAELKLESFPKTSGSKGLQVYVPLNTDDVTYDHTKPLSQALAKHLEKEHPDEVVSSQKKELRTGKVLIDWSQNDEHKTTVCVYSLRARERPTVSTPLEWSEVEAALEAEDADALVFDAGQVLDRVEKRGDLFEPVLTVEQRLPAL
jgi:bifunctional non-homologous end joining protein LigD